MNLLKDKFLLLLCLLLASYATQSIAERADRDKPIQVDADHVTVDDANQVSTFDGNVQMRQGTLLIEGTKIVVTQDKKGYSKIVATGQLAHFRQKRDGVNQFSEGFGERIEYDNFIEIANIVGQARVKRDGDDVKGEHIIYNTKTGVFKVYGSSSQDPDTTGQGRVQIIIQPKDQQNKPVPQTETQSDKPATNTIAPPKP
jgi:lipopolysaccharide export system protein LptA